MVYYVTPYKKYLPGMLAIVSNMITKCWSIIKHHENKEEGGHRIEMQRINVISDQMKFI